jgi:hypothetical protein
MIAQVLSFQILISPMAPSVHSIDELNLISLRWLSRKQAHTKSLEEFIRIGLFICLRAPRKFGQGRGNLPIEAWPENESQAMVCA